MFSEVTDDPPLLWDTRRGFSASPRVEVESVASSLSRDSTQLQDASKLFMALMPQCLELSYSVVVNELVQEFAAVVNLAVPLLIEKTGERLSSEEKYLRRDGLLKHLRRARDILVANSSCPTLPEMTELASHTNMELQEKLSADALLQQLQNPQ